MFQHSTWHWLCNNFPLSCDFTESISSFWKGKNDSETFPHFMWIFVQSFLMGITHEYLKVDFWPWTLMWGMDSRVRTFVGQNKCELLQSNYPLGKLRNQAIEVVTKCSEAFHSTQVRWDEVSLIKFWLLQGNSYWFHHIYRSLMVNDPEEMVASNSPWPLSKKKETIEDCNHRPKAKYIVKVIW